MKRKDQKVAQIVAAATAEFLNRGFDAASMHAIADRAEVSKRTLYKYYPNKDSLYSALIDEILDRVEDMYPFEYSSDVDVPTEIDKIVAAKIELTLADSFLNISKIVIGELFKSRMPTAEQMERLNRSEALFVEWIARAQKDGKIKNEVEAEEIANEFHSILKGKIYWPVLMGIQEKSQLDLQKVKESTVNFFLKSFC